MRCIIFSSSSLYAKLWWGLLFSLLLIAPMFAALSQANTPTERQASIVVVGGGLAGLSATIEALRLGASVVLLDKESNMGGNSAKATR